MNRIKILIVSIISLLITFMLLNNSSFLQAGTETSAPKLLAHRGLAQTFDIENVEWDTNTAAVIYRPEHSYLENTIASIRAAFEYGADTVEFDIRLTKDNELAVFHDYLLDFRTEASGNVSDYSLAELQTLDVGWGYTYDGGTTYPFRTKGTGLMPSFDQVAAEFPDGKFLVHIKDGGPLIGEILLAKLMLMDDQQRNNYSVYGNDKAVEMIRKVYPEMMSFTRSKLQRGLIQYMLIGWTGIIPESIRNTGVHIPLKYAKFLWGWPRKFVKRMEGVNSRVVLVRMKGPWTGGFDSPEDLDHIPDNYSGYIMTDRIDIIGPVFQ